MRPSCAIPTPGPITPPPPPVRHAHPQIAGLIGADPKEIIFTSGATESNNTAIKGVASYFKDKKKHVITTQVRAVGGREGRRSQGAQSQGAVIRQGRQAGCVFSWTLGWSVCLTLLLTPDVLACSATDGAQVRVGQLPLASAAWLGRHLPAGEAAGEGECGVVWVWGRISPHTAGVSKEGWCSQPTLICPRLHPCSLSSSPPAYCHAFMLFILHHIDRGDGDGEHNHVCIVTASILNPTSQVRPDGLLDLAVLEAAMRPDTALVSVMAVNNEIGVVQPVDEIGEMCRKRGVYFHTDGAQVRAAGGRGAEREIERERECVRACVCVCVCVCGKRRGKGSTMCMRMRGVCDAVLCKLWFSASVPVIRCTWRHLAVCHRRWVRSLLT